MKSFDEGIRAAFRDHWVRDVMSQKTTLGLDEYTREATRSPPAAPACIADLCDMIVDLTTDKADGQAMTIMDGPVMRLIEAIDWRELATELRSLHKYTEELQEELRQRDQFRID